MIHPAHLPTMPPGTPEVVRRFVMSFGGLLEAIGRAFNPNPRPPVPTLLLWAYMIRLRTRFIRLWPRIVAGIVPRPRGPQRKRERAERKTPRLRLPGRKAWLVGEIGWFGCAFASQLRFLFNEPETAALIAASPQAQSLLRPFCRMLAIELPSIAALSRRPRTPRPRSLKPKRLTRKEREAILWYPNSEGRPMKLLPRKLPRD